MRGLIGLCFLLLNFVIVPLSAAQSAESDDAEANPGRPYRIDAGDTDAGGLSTI
jgi:hypothetical protein